MQEAYPVSEMQRMSSVAERDLSLLRSIFTGALAPSTNKATETDDELPAAGAPTLSAVQADFLALAEADENCYGYGTWQSQSL